MAQAVMTLFRGEPDNARARPSSLIKKDKDYNSIFFKDYPLDAFLVAASTIRAIELELKKTKMPNFAAQNKNNIKFYVLYWVCAIKAKSISLDANKVAKLKEQISSDDIKGAISKVWDLFSAAGGDDQVAKGPKFKEIVKTEVQNMLRSNPQVS